MCESTNIGLKTPHLMIVTDLAKQVRQKGIVYAGLLSEETTTCLKRKMIIM
jgi:hypothetical protein